MESLVRDFIPGRQKENKNKKIKNDHRAAGNRENYRDVTLFKRNSASPRSNGRAATANYRPVE